ncbi:hypothetical protein CYJ10_19105 [Cupriavidus pauculus]|uniref:Uncharacterized protein n=2 Tax=Cupriavidus pauculus TaxID=82633 RepID=A0A2N5C9J6_9BURK|nr:hypothetical protein CYJ10_19105 [Cupriavidus pauculus]
MLVAYLGLTPISNANAYPVQPNQRSNVPVDHSNASTVYRNLPRTIGNIKSVAVLVEGKSVAYMSDSEACILQTTRPHSYPLEGLKFYTLWQGQDNLYRGEGCVAKDEEGRLLSLGWVYPRDDKGFTRPYGQRFEFIRADWKDAPAYLWKEKRRK